MNGDGYNYDALYIPSDEQVANREFRFVSDGDKNRFMDYVHANSYLKNHQGEYAEPYSLYSPWVHRIDFSYKHDFSLNVCGAKHTLQLLFDMKNVLNFFNSSSPRPSFPTRPSVSAGMLLSVSSTSSTNS